MSQIFISYSKQDKQRIQPIISLLEKQGYDVFWDNEIPTGSSWNEFIPKKISESTIVLVVWSINSVDSKWVKEEAEEAKNKNKLFPIIIDNISPPFGFGTIQAVDLSKWNGEKDYPAAKRLLKDISIKLDIKKEEEPIIINDFEKKTIKKPINTSKDFNSVNTNTYILSFIALLCWILTIVPVGPVSIILGNLSILILIIIGYKYGKVVGLISGLMIFLPSLVLHQFSFNTEDTVILSKNVLHISDINFITLGSAYLYYSLIGFFAGYFKELMIKYSKIYSWINLNKEVNTRLMFLYVVVTYLISFSINIAQFSFNFNYLWFSLAIFIAFKHGYQYTFKYLLFLIPIFIIYVYAGNVRYGSYGNMNYYLIYYFAIMSIGCIDYKKIFKEKSSNIYILFFLFCLISGINMYYNVFVDLVELKFLLSIDLLVLPILIVISFFYGIRTGIILFIMLSIFNLVSFKITESYNWNIDNIYVYVSPLFIILGGLLKKENFIKYSLLSLTVMQLSIVYIKLLTNSKLINIYAIIPEIILQLLSMYLLYFIFIKNYNTKDRILIKT